LNLTDEDKQLLFEQGELGQSKQEEEDEDDVD